MSDSPSTSPTTSSPSGDALTASDQAPQPIMQQDDSARTITAAERVIAIPELRQDIMSRLSRKEVAIMMRSSKMLFGDAVAVVYASIIDKEVEKMTRKTKRQRQYCDAVRHVELCEYLPDRNLAKRIMGGSAKPTTSAIRQAFWTYNPVRVSGLIRHFRARFPNLITLSWCPKSAVETWIVRLDRASALEGKIEVTRDLWSWYPFRAMRQEEWGAPHGYSFTGRAVLRYRPLMSIANAIDLLASIRGPLHSIDFVNMPIHFNCDALFADARISRELFRLRPKEFSIAMASTNVDHFVQRFIAKYGGELTALRILAERSFISQSAISFATFRNMLVNMPRSLPKLRILSVCVMVSMADEHAALPLLKDTGTTDIELEFLDVHVIVLTGPLSARSPMLKADFLNVTRFFLLLVVTGGTCNIAVAGSARHQVFTDNILRRPQFERCVLLTADLGALDVYHYEHIQDIHFDRIGQPVRRGMHLVKAACAALDDSQVQLDLDTIAQTGQSIATRIEAVGAMLNETSDEELISTLDVIAREREQVRQSLRQIWMAWEMTALMQWRISMKASMGA